MSLGATAARYVLIRRDFGCRRVYIMYINLMILIYYTGFERTVLSAAHLPVFAISNVLCIS